MSAKPVYWNWLGKYPIPDTVTITISRDDAEYMAGFLQHEWVDERLDSISDACRAALEGER